MSVSSPYAIESSFGFGKAATVANSLPMPILMVGARPSEWSIRYPVNEAAARFGASVPAETTDGAEAYADWGGGFSPTMLPWPPR